MINTKIFKIKMIEKDMTTSEIADILNINVNTVSRWVNGNNLKQIECFIDMCKILDINISDIKKEVL